MKEWEIEGREVTSNSLWRIIEDFENGVLSPAARDDLFQVLEESPRARSIYLSYFELSALLQIKAETKKEEGTLPVLPQAGVPRRSLGYSVLAAAAVLLLIALGAALVNLRQAELPSVALEATSGSDWSAYLNGERTDPAKGELQQGSVIAVASGTVSLTTDSGARLIVQGPARVSFPSFDRPVLEKGWLWVDSGAGGARLRIQTPEGTLENIGTRFGVRVRQGAPSELHLLEGEIEMRWKSGVAPTRFKASDEARALASKASEEGLPLAPDPFPGVEEMLRSDAGYLTTVMGQSPVGCWRLEGEDPREVPNEVAGGALGLYSRGVQPAAPGVRPVDGWHGFAPGNRAVFFTGAIDDSVVYNLDGPGGVSPVEGAVAFWFRREPGLDRPEVLWFAGLPQGAGLGPVDQMQAFLSDEGRLQFFIEEGRYDVLLSSPRSAADGAWHHAVATWNLDRVELYLDGQLVSRDEEYRKADGPRFKGIDVRLGKTGSGTHSKNGRDLMPFHGWIDELALWSRMLTPGEIALQYRAAVGSPEPGEEAGDR